jgi:endonuclease/exonuclease/phosphatase family metal-dependent hydrolase
VKGLGINFGTALLSDVPLHDCRARTFEPNWPTFSRGFVISAVEWPGRPGFYVDVVSVHLDIASADARGEQVAQRAAALRERGRPRPHGHLS